MLKDNAPIGHGRVLNWGLALSMSLWYADGMMSSEPTAVEDQRTLADSLTTLRAGSLTPEAFAHLEEACARLETSDDGVALSSGEYAELLRRFTREQPETEPMRVADACFYAGMGAFVIYWALMVTGLLPWSSRSNASTQLNNAVQHNQLAQSVVDGRSPKTTKVVE